MRILVIAPPWLPVPPPQYGGTEAVVDNLARGLADAGHDVLLFATGDSASAVPRRWVLEHAAGTVSIGSATELRHVIHAYRTVEDWRPDVVHDHTLVGPVYGPKFQVPIVTTNHGPFDSELGELYREVAGAVPTIAISRHHASRAQDTPIAAVIPHGVDVESFPFGDGDGGYALFLGRMTPDKGVHTAALITRRAGIPLRIAGKMREPQEQAYFHECVEPLIRSNEIEYVGEVGGTDKLELLGAARCLLNPIAWPEPFGMVMIEALACGTPIVATPCGSVPEIVDDGVTGFVRADERGLVDAVRSAGELDRARCRADALARFSTTRMVADHIDLYRRLIEAREPGQAA